MSTRTDSLLDDPQLRAFLPLLLAAWADGDLAADERAQITAQLEEAPWLRPAGRALVRAWLDPSDPPDAHELAQLQSTLDRALANLDAADRRSLSRSATALAGADHPEATKVAHTLLRQLGLGGAHTPQAHGIASVALPVASLTAALDGTHVDVRRRARAFLDDPERRMYGLGKDAQRDKVRGWLRELSATGLLDLAFPGVTSEVADLQPFMTLFETLALGDLSLVVKTGVQVGLFGGSLYFLGTERHHARLADTASLRLLGCFAMSEVGHGSNVAALETLARYDAQTHELVLHTPREAARKEWIGGAAEDARVATVFAQLEVAGENHGVHAFLVPLRDDAGSPLPGVRIGDCGWKMGLNGVDNGRLWFDQVRVPVEALLDRFATLDASGTYASPIASRSRRFFTMLGTLVGGRICVGSAGVSVAKSALAIAIRYSLARRQFGPETGEIPLLRYPTHQRRLLPPLATTYVLSLAFERLRARFAEVHAAEGEVDTRELEAEAAGLKVAATWHATRTVQLAREACGGQGYLGVNRLPDLRADSDVFSTFEGDNTVLLQLVAKSLVSRFRRDLQGGVASVARLVASIAAERVVDMNPVMARRTDPEHVSDPTYLRATLEHRATTLVRSAARRLAKRLGDEMDPNDALLEVQEHLVAAASAWVDQLAYDWFSDALAEGAHVDDEARPWLERLGVLHALCLVERDAGWYLESGWLAPPKARAIRKEIERRMAELVPAAAGLVEAFAIPDACLAAPIAFFDPATPP
ncbi:MAG: acyl-CoA dehydrogenase family protein [Sandaracinus sp.]|nr:acyl-CoA dehydrogenase family protein [Sandaracinus sp.]MCB9613358.1 acyl-CoA dehydrogenase family protein [Sandaracinus sp.]MCB9625182.1 acyl-CoA dehydrogenase family protein [Sandaracinus sp.]MCB9632152.1 acyl-CoA dehydrogenase family protein [Sandaracinus sp.]